mmetsp:Transcript_17392/g.40961  ORF Transcript_17392/g.40961 Transcript_17392/m.40961 type:complete len:321 (-) Transcript_17392:1781-2743(-)
MVQGRLEYLDASRQSDVTFFKIDPALQSKRCDELFPAEGANALQRLHDDEAACQPGMPLDVLRQGHVDAAELRDKQVVKASVHQHAVHDERREEQRTLVRDALHVFHAHQPPGKLYQQLHYVGHVLELLGSNNLHLADHCCNGKGEEGNAGGHRTQAKKDLGYCLCTEDFVLRHFDRHGGQIQDEKREQKHSAHGKHFVEVLHAIRDGVTMDLNHILCLPEAVAQGLYCKHCEQVQGQQQGELLLPLRQIAGDAPPPYSHELLAKHGPVHLASMPERKAAEAEDIDEQPGSCQKLVGLMVVEEHLLAEVTLCDHVEDEGE